MNKPDLYNESNQATYCPEDDRLRLYVGRVPHEEYLALKAEGWTSTPKQDCDFVAPWTPAREDTALSYAGIIDDEDQSPQDRAADRADRFSTYGEKRLAEATNHANRFDAGPSVHGYQSQARAVRAADRHDRIAGRAVNAWDKAEYWSSRTSGVIAHALHRCRPDVRMGRIKTLEAELRKLESSWKESIATAQLRFDVVRSVVDHAAGTREKVLIGSMPDFRWELGKICPEGEEATPEHLRRAALAAALDTWRNSDASRAAGKEALDGTRPAADIAREWLETHTRPEDYNPDDCRGAVHLRNRLAYENQMLEAQGGRAAHVEMEPGGRLGSFLIVRVYRSTATKRVTSVDLLHKTKPGPRDYGFKQIPGTDFYVSKVETERMEASAYTAPTTESLAELAALETGKKEQRKDAPKAPPLVNPTMEDAERLQALLNSRETVPGYVKDHTPSTVLRMTQAQYSANSGGNYSGAATAELCAMGKTRNGGFNARVINARQGPVLCKVRLASHSGYHNAKRVIVITDKPQKPLPAALFESFTPADTPDSLVPLASAVIDMVQGGYSAQMDEAAQALRFRAEVAGIIGTNGSAHWTEEGIKWARAHAPERFASSFTR